MISSQYFVLLIVTTLLVGDVAGDEPKCSKFDFEEKLLELVVRMEFQMKQLTTEMTQAVEKIISTRNTVESRLKVLDSERDRLSSDITANLSALQQHVATLVDRKIEKIETVTDRVMMTKLLFRVVQSKSTFNVKTGDIIVLSEVLHNEDAYDPSTGVFTATVNGTYVFNVRLCLNKEKYVKPAIMVDGTEQDVFTFYSATAYFYLTAETIVVLNEGQKVWLQIYDASGSAIIYGDNTRWSTFTGRIL